MASALRARAAWLAEACDGDEALRVEVENMLAAHARTDGLLDRDGGVLHAADELGAGLERPGDRLSHLLGVRELVVGVDEKHRVDLSLGVADGDRAGKVLIDLKTGGFSPQHLDDLRFYALIEAVRLGTPPRLLATYYLDQGRFLPEAVTEDLLYSTVARVVDGIERILDTRKREREPRTAPGPACRWCIALHQCETGRRFLDDGDETGLGDGW